MQTILTGDCLQIMPTLEANSFDVIVTSPPYNIGAKYSQYQDNLKRQDYLNWINQVFTELKRLLKPEGSFFLNIGFTCADPWIADDVAQEARQHFSLQNRIAWVKAITVNKPGQDEESYGHFKPINSPRFLNNTWEYVLHFTHEAKVSIDRLAIGTQYVHPSNQTRWQNKNDTRCRGNVWFIPYKTIQHKEEKGNHPAIFPPELVKRCIILHGLKPDLKVLDPFLGHGTTLEVAHQLKINGTGIELDPNYVKFVKTKLKLDKLND